jgi:hypothetical protein
VNRRGVAGFGLLHYRLRETAVLLRLFAGTEFTPVMLLHIARRQQLMLNENRARNGDSLREYVERQRNKLLAISLWKIGYRA